MLTDQKKINHLLWRAGFGPSPAQLKSGRSFKEVADDLFRDAKSYSDIQVVQQETSDVQAMKSMRSKDDQKKMKQERREEAKLVSEAWMHSMFTDEHAFREKMALFWHGHFACKCETGFLAQQYVNVIRKNALGNFRDLLFGVAKSPAMMRFLDTMKNKKDSPNENFSRELMELFTLGKGNYTEEDIKNAARAFTGWTIMPPGEFVFRSNQHDYGQKIIFGKKGNFDGDDVLNLLLENKQTAHHVTRKMYQFFVNDNVDERRVEMLADEFYRSGYNIEALMKSIFYSEWFYGEENYGTKIKSPVELVAGLTRTFKISFADYRSLLLPQRTMGQLLFNPPNVAGWPGGKSWIDSSSLMYRLNFAGTILGQNNYELVPKGDVEDMAAVERNSNGGQKRVTADWSAYLSLFGGTDRADVGSLASSYLIQPSLKYDQQIIDAFTVKDAADSYIHSVTMRLLSLPEYQMC